MTFGIHFENDYKLDNFSDTHNTNQLILHNWQLKAIKMFVKEKRLLVECATGTGKSLYAIECMKKIIEIDKDIKILIVCPKNVIMERGWFPELLAAGFTLKEIGIFYGDIKEEMKITITNMQSVLKMDISKYDFLVIDEIHWAGGQKLFGVLQLPFKYKLGLTATLARLDKKHYDILECFDYNLYKYDIQEALHDDIISSFNFVSVGIHLDSTTRDEYEDYCDKISFIYQKFGSYQHILKYGDIRLQNQLMALLNGRKQLVNNYEKKFEVMKCIVKNNMNNKMLIFNQFNDQTNRAYWELLEEDIKAEIIHSGVNKEKRDDILTRYKKDKFNILLTSKVLDEGYNLPSINGVILMSNDTSGKRQLIQRIGRSLRKKKDGTNSSVYLLYILDSIEENVDNIQMLKNLSSRYKEYSFNHDEEVIMQ